MLYLAGLLVAVVAGGYAGYTWGKKAQALALSLTAQGKKAAEEALFQANAELSKLKAKV